MKLLCDRWEMKVFGNIDQRAGFEKPQSRCSRIVPLFTPPLSHVNLYLSYGIGLKLQSTSASLN